MQHQTLLCFSFDAAKLLLFVCLTKYFCRFLNVVQLNLNNRILKICYIACF